MPVQIAHKTISGAADLSSSAQAIFQCLPGADSWLQATIDSEKSVQTYPSEAVFLSSAMEGLYGSRSLLLENIGLFSCPAKLLDIDSAALFELFQFNQLPIATQSAYQVQQLKNTLSRCNLLAAGDLDALENWLQAYGIAQELRIRYAGLEERLQLVELTKIATDNPTLQFLIAWVLEKSVSAGDIGNLIRFCQRIIDGLGDNPSQADQVVNQVYKVLLPIAEGSLNCPAVHSAPGQQELKNIIAAWYAGGRQLGFLSVSSALQQLVNGIDFSDLSAAGIATSVQSYSDSMHRFVQSNMADSADACQLGEGWNYYLNNQGALATICCRNGILYLADYSGAQQAA